MAKSSKKSTELVKAKSEVKVLTPLTKLVEAYFEAETKIKAMEAELDPLKEAKTAIKAEIAKVFKEERPGEFSSRVAGATIALSVRKTAQVINEPLLIQQLKKSGLANYITETTNEEFDTYKKLIASGEADLLAGMTIKETEFISIRSNDKKEPRKIVTGEFVKLKK